MWNLKNKINKQTKLKQVHRHRERSSRGRRGKGDGALGERGEGTKKHESVVKTVMGE